MFAGTNIMFNTAEGDRGYSWRGCKEMEGFQDYVAVWHNAGVQTDKWYDIQTFWLALLAQCVH